MRQFRWWTLVVCCSLFGPAWGFVEVNTASTADLTSIRGLGPSTSQRLVAARQESPFQSWDDLIARVSGIGPATAQRLSTNGLRVQGAPFSAGHADNPQTPTDNAAVWRPMVPQAVPPR